MFVARALGLPKTSFFLFGPRNTGKSTWLRHALGDDVVSVDLLSYDTVLELSRNPGQLESFIPAKKPRWVWLDEVQRVPELLNEVHRLMESRGLRFALSGSSARKLRRGGANLLAGRAETRSLEGFSHHEIPGGFEVEKALHWGCLPTLWTDKPSEQRAPEEFLSAYFNTYIKEEIREEGIIRRLDPFLRFLEVAGLMNGQIVNSNAIAREASIARSNVDGYFSILEDTLMGHFLPAWQPGAQVREVAHPKFYWFDPGVARVAAGLHRQALDRMTLGFQFETLIFHELRVYREFTRREWPIRYYAVPSGGEVDFVIETSRKTLRTPPEVVLIEAKLSEKWSSDWDKPGKALSESSQLRVKQRVGVYLGHREINRGKNDRVLPFKNFITELWKGQILK